MKKHASADRRARFRDRRGHYASSAFADMRDQYWGMTGEKETNPTDFWGKMKMMVGSAVEAQLIKEYFSDMHFYGVHLLGTQVPVGASDPAWDGALDVLIAYKGEDGKYKKYVIEIKTKSGYGANLLNDNPEASVEYLAQLGLYLKDLDKKGVTNEGCLLYTLLSDANFGRLVVIRCRYDSKTDEIVAFEAENMDGTLTVLNQRLKIGDIEERWKKLEEYTKSKKLPPVDKIYKYPLTPEFIDSLSDTKMREAISGKKVFGDWQIAYSRYKDKHMELQKGPGYTEQEVALLRKAYLVRHPKSKV